MMNIPIRIGIMRKIVKENGDFSFTFKHDPNCVTGDDLRNFIWFGNTALYILWRPITYYLKRGKLI